MRGIHQPVQGLRAPLLGPSSVKLALPLDEDTQANVQRARDAVRTILSKGASHGRLLVIVGPCSIHDPEAALHYASLLAEAAKKHHRELLIVMRVYIEKPRLYSEIRGPENNNPDLNKGVYISRKIMIDIARKGLPVVTELLNPLLVHYFTDVLALGVIGARTTESQTHREMSSDMPMPVGFKNGTDGGLKVATDAMEATSRPHTVIGVDEDGSFSYRISPGNTDTFMILRGGTQGTNFSPEHIHNAEKELLRAGKKPCIVVDCSHGNSSKDYRNQSKVADCLAEQIAADAPIMGVMLESNIHEGRQDVPGMGSNECLKYGVSITDGCVGWHETEAILDRLAAAVQKRQAGSAPMMGSVLNMVASNTLENGNHLVKILV